MALVGTMAGGHSAVRAAEPELNFPAESLDFFESRIRPVLEERCLDCHSADVDAREADLSLASRQAILAGGATGPAAIPGDPQGSLLIEMISRDDRLEAMPPDGQLADPVIADFRRWIEMGLPDPRTVDPEPAAETSDLGQPDASADHWAFQPPRRPKPPHDLAVSEVMNGARTDVDRRALATMQRAGLTPSPEAYRYRDWVIEAFNDDMPYDHFLVCQLAADQLPEEERLAALPAMGYLTLGRRYINNQHDIINDRIDVVSRGMLGLTVGCARCHDHKYDPIPTEDYYSLYAVFANSYEPKDDPCSLRLEDVEKIKDTRVFLRGNPRNPGDVVPRRFLRVLAGESRQPFTQGSGRWELAQAIASEENILTARVFVNRVWGHLFGSGLVTTPSDFGLRSTTPAQNEVLDYLAIEFMEQSWSTKQLIRTIVTSAIYRQSSDIRPEMVELDPDNRYFWRMNPLCSNSDVCLWPTDVRPIAAQRAAWFPGT